MAKMTDQRCIEDLKSIKAYFIKETGGSYPECIDYAIKKLEESKTKK